jgi:hypothetical protein
MEQEEILKNYKNTARFLITEIGKAEDLISKNDMSGIFMSAESIISSLAYLITPLAELEQKYRIEAITKDDESQAKAEARAKAGDTYKEWRKLDNLMELAKEQIMLLKKFRDDLAMEKQRS